MVTQSLTANPRRNKQSWQSQTWWCFLPVLGIALCISVFALTRVSSIADCLHIAHCCAWLRCPYTCSTLLTAQVSPSTGPHKAVAFADHSQPTTAGIAHKLDKQLLPGMVTVTHVFTHWDLQDITAKAFLVRLIWNNASMCQSCVCAHTK